MAKIDEILNSTLAPDHVYRIHKVVCDLKTQELYGGENFAAYLNMKDELKTLGDLKTLVLVDDLIGFNQRVEALIEEKKQYNPCEVAIKGRNGLHYFDFRAEMHTSGYAVFFFRDVTIEKMAQSVIAEHDAKSSHMSKMVALGEVAAGLAHEINNPLAIVYGHLEILKANLLTLPGFKENEKFELSFSKVFTNLKRVSEIVKSILIFARGVPEDMAETFNVIESIDELKKDLSTWRDTRTLKINLETDLSKEDCEIFNIKVALQQILMNLVSNAMAAMKNIQSPEIGIRIERMGAILRVTVKDNGPGISREIKEKIFDPFYSTKEIGEGTGLGLSISKGLANALGGDLALCEGTSHTTFELIVKRNVMEKDGAPFSGDNQNIA